MWTLAKVALITDTHWGVRNDSNIFLDNTEKFLKDIFFPRLDEGDIQTVIHLGDIVDRRKYINYATLKRLKNDFLQPLSDRALDVHIIAGNHDVYFKNTNEVNALRELIDNDDTYKNFNIYDRTAESINVDGLDILLIPWICNDNREQIENEINQTKSQIAMGHLEIEGFQMFKNSIASHGDDRNLFTRFDLVMSGHFHHRSSDNHIHYLGSHSEFTWSDYGDARGFHIFDTDTRTLEFIENPYKIFHKFVYDDSKGEQPFIDKNKANENIKDSYVKVVVSNKENNYWFDKYIDSIDVFGPFQIQIVEDHMHLDMEDADDIIDEAESTLDIFRKYIKGYDLKGMDNDRLYMKIEEIYQEAISIE